MVIRGRLRDAAESARESVRDRIRRERYRRELRKSEPPSLKERVRADLRGRGDIEPGSAAAEQLRRAGHSGLGAVYRAADTSRVRRQSAIRDEATEEVRRLEEAGKASPPNDNTLEPVPGLANMAEFISGERAPRWMREWEQTQDSQTQMEWRRPHSNGGMTVLSARKTRGEWVLEAVEYAPGMRREGEMVIGRPEDRRHAREWAFDWLEENPEGIPFHEKAGDVGPWGQMGRGMNRRGFGDRGVVFNADTSFVFGAERVHGGTGLVTEEDTAFVTGDGAGGDGTDGGFELDLEFADKLVFGGER